MIDSHCHLDAAEFATDRDDVIARARSRGLTDIVVPAVDRPTWRPILDLARTTESLRVHPAIGIHPVALPRWPEAQDPLEITALLELGRSSKLIAIGECGLDGTLDPVAAPMARQVRVLRPQLELARALGLPVVLHARGPNANNELVALLEEVGLVAGGVVHSYSGGPDLVPKFARHGLYFGFAGPATWPNARKVRAAIRAIPDDRLLAETDAPDQCPVPYRPGRSEPSYVAEVIAGLAVARDTTPDAIAKLTTDNARRAFRLNDR